MTNEIRRTKGRSSKRAAPAPVYQPPRHEMSFDRELIQGLLRQWTDFASGKTDAELSEHYRDSMRVLACVMRDKLAIPGRTVKIVASRAAWFVVTHFASEFVSDKRGNLLPPSPATRVAHMIVTRFDKIPDDSMPPRLTPDRRLELAAR